MSELAERIERRIAEAGLIPGARLPPERQLAAEMQVSRSRLREAIQYLASRGIVRSRQGGGTFVADPAAASDAVALALRPLAPLARSEAGLWQDVMEVRRSLDGDAAALAALRAGEAERAALDMALAAADASVGDDAGVQARADAGLHTAIAEASRNALLHQTMAGLIAVLEESISESLARLYVMPGATEALRAQHHGIVTAIREGRAEDARLAAVRHLDFVEERLRSIEDEAARERQAARAFAKLNERKETAR